MCIRDSCQSDAKGYLLPDYYSGATGIPGRFSEGLLLRRLQTRMHRLMSVIGGYSGHRADLSGFPVMTVIWVTRLRPVVTAATLRGSRFPSIQICSHARGALAGFSGLV